MRWKLLNSIKNKFNNWLFSFCFSYDARSAGPENGKRWSDEERGFGKRAYLEVQKDSINQVSEDRTKAILSYLHIQDIHANEAGLYKCRVDFKTAPTKNYYMNLSVIGKLHNRYNYHKQSYNINMEK